MKEYGIDLIHLLDPIQCEFLILYTTLADPEPEPKLRYTGSGQMSYVQWARKVYSARKV
jgi:hypothetical protein